MVSKKIIKSDLKRIDAMTDEDIDYSDIPPLDDRFFENAVVVFRSPKQAITVRLDIDVLDWLKSQGRGYQTRINALLRQYMQHHLKTSKL